MVERISTQAWKLPTSSFSLNTSDWKPTIASTCVRERKTVCKTKEELHDFLHAGDKPIVVSWMVTVALDNTCTVAIGEDVVRLTSNVSEFSTSKSSVMGMLMQSLVCVKLRDTPMTVSL